MSVMHVKASPPISHLQFTRLPAIAEVWFEIAQLKHLFRQGWLRVGVPRDRCESVAEHSFGVALLSLFIAETHFAGRADANRVLRIALLHDVGEARVGDLTPHDPTTSDDKHMLERDAVRDILGKLPRGADYFAYWEEYERGESLEAKIVKQADRLEMALQATAYEHSLGMNLEEFYASARKAMESPEFRELLHGVENARPVPSN